MRNQIIVVDDFYADPDKVRSFAVATEFSSASRFNYPGWQSEKLLNSETLRLAIERLVGAPLQIDPARYSWGGFRIITEKTGRLTKVHADTAVDWAAMVYLLPDAPMSAGTGFFRHNEYGLAGPPSDREARALGFPDADAFEEQIARRDMANLSKWEMVGFVGPTYNRLVLFRGCELYHAPLAGAGDDPTNARLTHNFFFNEARK